MFNSLGSNYNLSFVLTALRNLGGSDAKYEKELKRALEKKFKGQATLVYKGRDAIELILKSFTIGEGDLVLTQAFTCHAIEEAITRVGAEPVYVDLVKAGLNPSVETLQVAFEKASHDKDKKVKAVLVQHTLGIPADVEKIAAWCKKRKLMLIEDLAQGVFGVDKNGQELGAAGQAVVLSFGRDKILDGVAGGAAIIKPTPPKKITVARQVPQSVINKDMLYPLLTWLIRKTHSIGIGKLIFKLAKMTKLLTSPVASPLEEVAAMPAAHARLALLALKQAPAQIAHRRKIARLYNQLIDNKNQQIKKLLTEDIINRGSNQRYLLWVKSPNELIKYLKKKKVFISDRWYRQAVDSGSLACTSVYKPGSCPNAEDLAQHIINLPTHINISLQQARTISQLVNKYSKNR